MRRTRHADARAGVDDRDGITDPSSGRLMHLERRWLTLVRGDVRERAGVEGEAGIGGHLVGLGGALGRATRQRRAIRRRRMDRHHVGLGEQVWTELEVIVEIEGPTGLEALPEI